MDDLSGFTFNVPASAQAFMDISAFMDANGITEPLAAIVTRALYDWIAAQTAARDQAASTALLGYQWKQAFLPDGTCLRAVLKGEHFMARVKGNAVIYGDKPVSPAQFVNHVFGFRCNAWKRVWLLLPGQMEWRLADNLRVASAPGQNWARKESHRVQKSRKELERVEKS